jgi:Rrf2 family protein
MAILSQTAEYALRAVVCLAAENSSLTVPQIAGRTGVPAGYLSKVLQSLARAGLIQSQRGMGGGFRLAHAANEITIFDVVNAVDTVPRIRECPLGIAEHEKLCPLHERLDTAMAAVEDAFRATVIGELVKTDSGKALSALCEPNPKS